MPVVHTQGKTQKTLSHTHTHRTSPQSMHMFPEQFTRSPPTIQTRRNQTTFVHPVVTGTLRTTSHQLRNQSLSSTNTPKPKQQRMTMTFAAVHTKLPQQFFLKKLLLEIDSLSWFFWGRAHRRSEQKQSDQNRHSAILFVLFFIFRSLYSRLRDVGSVRTYSTLTWRAACACRTRAPHPQGRSRQRGRTGRGGTRCKPTGDLQGEGEGGRRREYA